MVRIADIREWKPALLEEAFNGLRRELEDLLRVEDELAASKNPAGWTGPAAAAAAVEHERLCEQLRRIVAGGFAAARGIAEASDRAEAVLRALTEAEELAKFHSFLVSYDGQLTEPCPVVVPADQAAAVAAERAAVKAEVIDRLEQVQRQAADLGADLAAVLDRVKAGEIDDGMGATLVEAARAGEAVGGLSMLPPPPGGSPGDNAGWWASLSDGERNQILATRPQWVGNLDGIPAAVRDEANWARLDDERARLEAERDRLQADLDDNWFGGTFTNDDAALDHVNAKLAALDRIETTLEKGDRQLLLLDLSGERAEAAVAVGDVDTADHVAVFTPGLGSTVDGSLKGYDDNMERLRQQAEAESRRYGDDGSVAAVTWIGYQAPQPGLEGYNPGDSDSVLQGDSARAGGGDLADFYRGIDASRATDPHLTALGHSYGSTTTGFALQQETGVDDVVFFGSPGVGTSHTEDLQIPEGHSYRIEARRDWVADTGQFGIDPTHMDGMTGLSAREETLPDGRRLAESTGHSDYLAQDSTSQYNMSVVVAGLHDRRVDDEGRGLGDAGSWPVPGTY